MQLIKACLKGDPAGQRMLYDQYKAQMFRICLRYARSRADAEDFLQEGFVAVFRDLKQFRMQGPLGAWMRRVVVNVILQQLRKRKMVFSDPDALQFESLISEEPDISGNLDAEILTKYIQELPDGYRIVFNMYVIEGFTHQEIANELNISTGTSKSQLSKAKALLRSRIEVLQSQEKL